MDPVHGRRIYWGWNAYVAPAQGGLSLPRELTWHPELQQLVHSPLPELSLLRAKPALASVGTTALKAGETLSLGGRLPKNAGLQAEVQATFALPKHNASLGVVVMADSDAPEGTSGMLFWFDFSPPSAEGGVHSVEVGSTNLTISSKYQKIMHDTAIGCCGSNVSNVTGGYASCGKLCDDDDSAQGCVAWSFQPAKGAPASSPDGTCTRHNGLSNTAQTMWRGPVHSPNTTSGVLSPSPTLGGTRDTLQLSPSDTNLTIHVFVDNTMAEGFWQDGRVAMSRQCDPPPSSDAAVHAYSSAAAELEAASVWRMDDAWVTKEQLLQTPRADGQ